MGAELNGTEQHPGDPYATEYEQPVHGVTLDPFFIGKHELTQAQWQRWTGRNPARTGPGDTESGERRLLRPVWRIDFHQAEAVLFEMGLVLPTEAQWEYAARAGTTTPWWTGAELSSCHGACNVGDERLFKSGGLPKAAPHESFDDGWELPAPIGTHRVNPFGLDGMIGNVAEWCRDRYALYTTPALPGDGLRASDATQERVVRDGSFVLNLANARVSSRYRINANHTTPTVGVRPARKLACP
jgi:formylglycine-generating enzyme required for sulfatase activity